MYLDDYPASPDTYNHSLAGTTVEYGGKVVLTTSFTFKGTNLLYGGYVKSSGGTIDNDVTLTAGGATTTATVEQPVPAFDNAASVPLSVSGDLAFGTTPAGSVVTVTAGDGKEYDLVRTLTFSKADGTVTEMPGWGCTLTAGQTPTIGQVTVTQATTATTVSLSKPAKHKLTAKVVVAAPNSSQTATGKVRVSAHRSGKTVTKTVKLKDGKVTVKFTGLKKAKYTVTVKYVGTTNFTASTVTKTKKI